MTKRKGSWKVELKRWVLRCFLKDATEGLFEFRGTSPYIPGRGVGMN